MPGSACARLMAVSRLGNSAATFAVLIDRSLFEYVAAWRVLKRWTSA